MREVRPGESALMRPMSEAEVQETERQMNLTAGPPPLQQQDVTVPGRLTTAQVEPPPPSPRLFKQISLTTPPDSARGRMQSLYEQLHSQTPPDASQLKARYDETFPSGLWGKLLHLKRSLVGATGMSAEQYQEARDRLTDTYNLNQLANRITSSTATGLFRESGSSAQVDPAANAMLQHLPVDLVGVSDIATAQIYKRFLLRNADTGKPIIDSQTAAQLQTLVDSGRVSLDDAKTAFDDPHQALIFEKTIQLLAQEAKRGQQARLTDPKSQRINTAGAVSMIAPALLGSPTTLEQSTTQRTLIDPFLRAITGEPLPPAKPTPT